MDRTDWTAGVGERPAPNKSASSYVPEDFSSSLRDHDEDASTQEANHRDLESTQMDVDGSSSDIDSGSEIDLDELEQMFNQACDYARESEWEDAEELHSKVLDGRRRILGEDNVHTLNSMCELAGVYRRLGELQDAETLWLQVLPACRRMLSGAQLETIRNIVLLADTLFINWMLEEAGTLELEALSVCKRVLGDEHTETLVVMENLAIIYHKQGRIEEAAPLHRDVISMRKRILGADHIDTINSMHILANACYKHDRLEEAEELYLQLRDLNRVKDPEVDRNMPNLASIYDEQGDGSIWEQAHLRIISIRKLRLGDEHVDTLRSIHELAKKYAYMNNHASAMSLHLQAMILRRRVLGDEHVDALDSMCHLANSYHQCKKLDEAKQMYLQAIAIQNRTASDSRIQTIDGVPICKRVLGDAHATTLEYMYRLARDFIDRQRLEEAEQLLLQVVPMRIRMLGEEHNDTFESALDLAFVHIRQGRVAEANHLHSQSGSLPELRVRRLFCQKTQNDVSALATTTMEDVDEDMRSIRGYHNGGLPYVSAKTTISDVYTYLVQHGCADLSSQLDPSSFPEAAFSGGRFGDVWCGSLQNRAKVAVKCLRLHTVDEAHSKVLKHAARELYYWSKLKHVCVLELLGFAMFQGQLAMISPWMESGTLNDYIHKHPEKNRWHLCWGVASGLEYIHSVGMVHGDLKAMHIEFQNNILVDAYGNVKLTDFGNSVLASHSLAFSGTSIAGGGTSRWMAPELIVQEDGTAADRSMPADIYAFGMTILVSGANGYSLAS
ncbi:hypothetical protein FRC07_010350 [Ceratobasidium sp. 392]|nr:hypothetical protein FRC07_010350 [Ceratobasidium sp. 392]